MRTLRRYARLYAAFFAQSVKAKLEYRLDFALGIAATFLTQAAGLVFLGVVFSKVPHIHGWSLYEVALIYGIAGAARGLTEFLFDNVWWLSWVYVREGRFDHLLHRPVDPLFHFIADRVETHGLGNLVTGLAVVAVAWSHLGIPVTAGRLAFLAVALASGACIHFAINLAAASLSFWLVDMRHLIGTLDSFSALGRYPLVIYPQGLQFFLTWILPYGFVAFFPAGFLLDRPGFATIGLFAPVVAAAALLAAAAVFRRGLAAYESTGS